MEPKLISLLVCDQVITDKNNKHTLVGVFDRINAKTFPVRHSKMFVFLAWLNKKSGKKYVLDIEIVDPEGNPLQEKINKFSIEFPEDKTRVYGIFDFNNVFFNKKGTFVVTVFLNRKKVGELPIEVGSPQN